MRTRERRMTRQQLYDLLWEKPLKILEKELGIWYYRLIEVSEEYNIPRPPMGYWMKIEHGKPVRKPPLAPLTGKEELVLNLHVEDNRPYDDEQKQLAEKLLAEEVLPDRRIIVPNELNSL